VQIRDLGKKKYETSVTEILLMYNNMAAERNTYLASSFFVITNDAFEIVEQNTINPLNAELNSIFHLLALLGARHILHVNRIRVKRTLHIIFHE